MLNTINLAIVSMLSMGMASNVMPFGHTNKAPLNTTDITTLENDTSSSNPYINDYEIYLTQSGNASATINHANGEIEEAESATIHANNSYLNVWGSYYGSYMKDRNGNNNEYEIQVKEYLQGINQNYDRNSTMFGFLLKITPYNYNIDNDIKIRISINLDSEYTYGDYDYTLTNQYWYKAIYQTTENLDYLIGQQLTGYTLYNTAHEITNINNGFYYSLTEETIEITEQETRTTTEFEIAPQIDNYILIQFIPMVDATYTSQNYGNGNVDDQPYLPVPLLTIGYRADRLIISGRNIIPSGTYEVIDLPGLMWEIITMPFAFVSQAFNLTLFPGTPYQINIANLFLSIMAILVFVWVISLFLKMKG